MITLRVEAATGHYRIPGQVSMGCEAASFAIAPFSTVRGFIESLCGKEQGWFKGSVAYGWMEPPLGQGSFYRLTHVISSREYATRPIHVPTFLRPRYCISIKADSEQEAWIRSALAGDVDRFGVLYLGESGDIITWMEELSALPADVQWVVPGRQFPLTVKTGRGYGNYGPTIQHFKYGVEPHYLDFKEVT